MAQTSNPYNFNMFNYFASTSLSIKIPDFTAYRIFFFLTNTQSFFSFLSQEKFKPILRSKDDIIRIKLLLILNFFFMQIDRFELLLLVATLVSSWECAHYSSRWLKELPLWVWLKLWHTEKKQKTKTNLMPAWLLDPASKWKSTEVHNL